MLWHNLIKHKYHHIITINTFYFMFYVKKVVTDRITYQLCLRISKFLRFFSCKRCINVDSVYCDGIDDQ